MKLTGPSWENYSTPFIKEHKDDAFWQEHFPDNLELTTSSVGELQENIHEMERHCKHNKKDVNNVPVFVEVDGKLYTMNSFSMSARCINIIVSKSDALEYTAPDSKPEVGEFWSSRGPSNSDCAGFVKSKKAGERIMRLVRYILDKDETNTWLDYRESEPNWIQVKFSADEFDINKLHDASVELNGVITEAVLRDCKL